MLGALVAYRTVMHQKACDQWPWPAGQPDFYRFIINIDVAFNAEFSSNTDILSGNEEGIFRVSQWSCRSMDVSNVQCRMQAVSGNLLQRTISVLISTIFQHSRSQ
ncbi:hypothetical protein ACQR5V_13085 [Xanthomonas oryzae pv. oryzicola]|uniref:hypothetical protein n=1 Tax=Xanthomonas oryzae TaxID=347 RepID=UPI0006557F04|nr:hypothetical protein [Xanthomonas oryzae]AKO05540.1 hypothetical protein ACU16_16950 [Xanthomonas oryzae pv. oryzicola]